MKVRRVVALLSLLVLVARLEAKPNSAAKTPTGLDRTAITLGLHQFNLNRRGNALSTDRRNVSADQGNVSILHDDGTLIIPQNVFDLAGRALTFTPQGNAYTLTVGTSAFDTGSGATTSTLFLGDDD